MPPSAELAAGPPTRRLLVLSSTFPARRGDATPGFVRDLATYEAQHLDTLVLVPRVAGAAAGDELVDGMRVRRFAYFPRRWETLADGPMIENLRRDRLAVLQVPCFALAQVVAVRRAVRSHRPDVVHVHWLVPQGVSALLAARRVPWVVTSHGADLHTLRGALAGRLKRAVARRARAATAPNREMRDLLVQLGADPSTTQVLPVPVDLDAMRAATVGEVRDGRTILFVGRLVEKKGVQVLLDAVRSLGSEADLRVVIGGDGPLRAPLEASAVGLPVEFLGSLTRAQVAEQLAGAAVVVFPSVPAGTGDQDGLPVALLEAIATGPAVVASRLPGLDEAIEDDVHGLLVAPGDAGALAGALHRLLGDDGLRRRLGEHAARRAERYSVPAIGARFVQLLDDAAAGRSAST